MKTKFWVIILIAVVVGMGIWGLNEKKQADKLKQEQQQKLSGAFSDYSSYNIVGSSDNLLSVPRVAVFANNTTTPITGVWGMADGATVATTTAPTSTVQQTFFTPGVRKGIIFTEAVGPTATSTLYTRIMGSFDGETFYNISTSTDERETATSTVGDSLLARQWDPGTATTSDSFSFEIDGYRYIRIIPWSEGWTGDLDTGVQAWMEFVPITDL